MIVFFRRAAVVLKNAACIFVQAAPSDSPAARLHPFDHTNRAGAGRTDACPVPPICAMDRHFQPAHPHHANCRTTLKMPNTSPVVGF